mgnify:CR=1 FL=1|jgi:Multimeric flavodoxin WrbA
MKLCVVVGSGRKDGISQQVCGLIKQFCENRLTCDFIFLADHRINICDQDNKCFNSPCQLDDDVKAIVERMIAADAIIYMPVMHAYGTNSRFQSFLERVGYGFLRPMGRPLRDKLAGVVVVGRRYGHTAVYSQVLLNILLNKMILVGSGFPATFYGMLGSADEDLEAIETLYEMISRMIEFSVKMNRSVFTAEQIVA